ncbi:MAG: phage terminase large subunit family protein [Deltaproteobacteria bacterium]|nr:phage terminase large subunit family protein [Deltaproteobacteria bacterium]
MRGEASRRPPRRALTMRAGHARGAEHRGRRAMIPELLADADIASLVAAMRRGLTSPEQLTVSGFAERYRRLTTKTSSEPGPWRNSRAPFMREIMDRLSPQDPCETVVLMAGSQVAKTECGNNWVGHTILINPCPMMLVTSNLDLAKDWSQKRFEDMIDATPELRARIGRRAGQRMKALAIDFPGGALFFRGANASAGLRSTPIRNLHLDEYSGYPRSVGRDGDPVRNAIARTRAFPNRKIFKSSTPLLAGSCRVEADYERTDKRRYEFACPHCGALQFLEHDRLRWEPGRPDLCVYACVACPEPILERHKDRMLQEDAGAQWVATAVAKDPRTYGYQLGAIYSLFYRWEEIAAEVERARAAKDPAIWQALWNGTYGLPYEDKSNDAVDVAKLLGWRRDWWRGPSGELGVPAEVGVLVAAVDVQDDRLEAIVYGAGRDRELWCIDWRVFYGRPSNPRVWAHLDEFLDRTFPHETAPDGMRISATAIDSSAYTQEVYDYCLARWDLGRYPVKGRIGDIGIWATPRGVKSKRDQRATFYRVGIDTAKTWIFARLAECAPDGSPRPMIHFGEDRDAEFFAQLMAERRVLRHVGGTPLWTWEKIEDGARNEILDLTVYAIGALHALLQEGLDLDRAVEVAQQKRKSVAQEIEDAPIRESRWLRRRH